MATPKLRNSLSTILKSLAPKAALLPAVVAVVFTLPWLGLGPIGVCPIALAARTAPDDVDFRRSAAGAQPEALEGDPATSEASTDEPSLFSSNFALQLKLVNSVVSQLDFQVCRINSILAKVLFYDFGTSQLKQFGAADIQPQTAREYFGGRHDELFAEEIPNVLTKFSQRYERLPQDVNEAKAALSSAGVALPDLPHGTAYDFDPDRSEFMVMPRGFGIPLIAAWLVFGGAFLTLRMRLINLRGILHAIALISGKYDSSHKIGQLNHFRTFTTSLASTVGLGAISGVAVAVCLGGPGTAFWIMAFGVLAMSTKFTECTLGQIYRRVNAQGAVLGGPMRYLRSGFKLRKFVGFSMAPFGMVLSWLFAALCVCVSLTAGNTLQVSQSLGSLQSVKGLEFLQTEPWIFGLFMMAAVALVVLGGVRLIGRVTGWLAPLMCLFYVGACSWLSHRILRTSRLRSKPFSLRLLNLRRFSRAVLLA